MTKEEQFEILKTTIKNFLIDNKHFDTKEAEDWVGTIHNYITELIEQDDKDFGLTLEDYNTIDGYDIERTI